MQRCLVAPFENCILPLAPGDCLIPPGPLGIAILPLAPGDCHTTPGPWGLPYSSRAPGDCHTTPGPWGLPYSSLAPGDCHIPPWPLGIAIFLPGPWGMTEPVVYRHCSSIRIISLVWNLFSAVIDSTIQTPIVIDSTIQTPLILQPCPRMTGLITSLSLVSMAMMAQLSKL